MGFYTTQPDLEFTARIKATHFYQARMSAYLQLFSYSYRYIYLTSPAFHLTRGAARCAP